MSQFRVLDPACGSGNFLYTAFLEVKAIERQLIRKMLDLDAKQTKETLNSIRLVSTRQFYGMDVLPFAVELAKVTLMLAKEIAVMHPPDDDPEVSELVKDSESALPLDNLDGNIFIRDAVFDPWPEADAIIGNPPFQSKNKMQEELGAATVARLRARFPDVPGRADFCVYWLRIAHDQLKPGGRAGLVGTNTIRQNYSREGGLDYIVQNDGVILEAVSSQPWSGAAAVHVSIVNWARRPDAGHGGSTLPLLAENAVTISEIDAPKRLYWVRGEDPNGQAFRIDLQWIGPSLSFGLDVSGAKRLRTNIESEACFQGQTHGHARFLLTASEAQIVLRREPNCSAVLFPYLTADEMLNFVPGRANKRKEPKTPIDQSSLFNKGIVAGPAPVNAEQDLSSAKTQSSDAVVWYPERFVIDFGDRDVISASTFKTPFQRVTELILPDRKRAYEKEKERNEGLSKQVNRHHENFYKYWWRLSYSRQDLISHLAKIDRYIACARVTKRPVFEFVSSQIHPNDALAVFALEDDYSYGILQSLMHWEWFIARCSTLKADFRYTSDSVFDTFVWPQKPTEAQIRAVADAGIALRRLRHQLMTEHSMTLRALYRTLDTPGSNPLRTAHEKLDHAVRKAYGISESADILAHLLELNATCATHEQDGVTLTAPGLPAWVPDRESFVTKDCIFPG